MTSTPIERSLSESRPMAADPATVYEAVSDLGRMGRRSPEHIGSWRFWRGAPHPGSRFVGWNRNGWRVWPTTCRVVTAEPDRQFVFESSALGLPIARWGYAFEPASDGGTIVTETWDDLRSDGPAGAVVRWLGAVAGGTAPPERVERNRNGMRHTLEELAAEVERPGSGAASAG